MKQGLLAWILALVLVLGTLTAAGCSAQGIGQTQEKEDGAAGENQDPVVHTTVASGAETTEVTVRVGSLMGPTSMGLVSLMERAKEGSTENKYEFTMEAAADVINTALLKGELDMVLIPANVASTLYNKTGGEVVVLNINTLGVLYILENGETIHSVADLKGRTVYLPGKGTTPDYALQYLLAQNGLTTDDVDLQYKSEGTEVIAALGEDSSAIGLLPQPAVTTACIKNENLRIALNLTEEWDKVSGQGSLLTGVTLVRKAFLEEHEEAVKMFLADHAMSAAFANENVAEAAEMVANLGIVPQAAIAAKAIPYCNIVCVTGTEMKESLAGYLQVLYGQNPQAIGGAMPGDDFYYIP